MKTKLIIICSLSLLLVAGLIACAPSTGGVQVSCDDFSKTNDMTKSLEVKAGDTFTVTLCSNATTGYQWTENAVIGDKTIVEQTKHEFVAPDSDLMGAPGNEVWTFKALKAGTTTVAMDYSRDWEGGEKGEWTFKLNVIVK
jgi:inhibitor of cysteine peptidase